MDVMLCTIDKQLQLCYLPGHLSHMSLGKPMRVVVWFLHFLFKAKEQAESTSQSAQVASQNQLWRLPRSHGCCLTAVLRSEFSTGWSPVPRFRNCGNEIRVGWRPKFGLQCEICLCCSLFHNSYSKRHLRFFFKTKKHVTKASKCRVFMCFNSASTFSTFSTSSTFRFRSLTILLGSIALHISRVVTSETPGVFPSKRVAFFMWWKRMDFCLWYNLCIFRLNFTDRILIYIIVLVYNEFRIT